MYSREIIDVFPDLTTKTLAFFFFFFDTLTEAFQTLQDSNLLLDLQIRSRFDDLDHDQLHQECKLQIVF